MQPDKQDFEEWKAHPVTEWVVGLMSGWSDRQKDMWADMVWQGGENDPQALLEARVRADCYRAIPDMPYEDWAALEERLSDTEPE